MIPLRDANPTRRTPVVTIALIALCVVAFAYELGTQATGGEAGFERFLADFPEYESTAAAHCHGS